MLRCLGRGKINMENKEVEIKRVGPIVETVWGVLLLVSSFALIFIGG